MAVSEERNQILNVLYRVLEKGAFLQDALREDGLKALTEEEKKFTEAVCRSTVEHYFALVEILNKVSKTPVKKMRPQIRCILLSASCEILYLRTDDYASCNEAVRLAEKRGFSSLKGYVNGVLRTISREKKALLSGLSDEARSGLSPFLYQCFMEWVGPEKTRLVCKNLQAVDENVLTVRRVKQKNTPEVFEKSLTALEIPFEKMQGFDDIYTFYIQGNPGDLSIVKEGLCYPQSFGSILATDIAADLLSKADDEFSVLDACASPGGKILNAYDKAAGKGHFTACDVSLEKTGRISENFTRYELKNAEILIRDAAVFSPEFEQCFDLVLADVPCSGLGTLKGKPDIKLHVTKETLESINELQKKILSNVIRYVKPGGTLLFSTCTVNPAENEQNLQWLLKENPSFHPVDFSDQLPEYLRENMVKNGYLTLLPGLNGSEGFFISRIQKESVYL